MKGTSRQKTNITLITFILLFFIWLSFFIQPLINGQPYNATVIVNTTVNITNSAPILSFVSLQNIITLTGYSNTTVYCNMTVFDFDNDTVTANATLFLSGYSPSTPDDQNYHYSNSSCSQTGRYDTQTNFTCGFSVNFFANNGTWYCNGTVKDEHNSLSYNESAGAILQPLIAIVIPGIIDYGDMAQGDISPDVTANITNGGNRNINISVEGWGSVPGDGLAMNCTFGNIGLSNERYNITANSGYPNMYQLTGTTTMIPRFYISQRTSETQDSFNTTYWQLYIPVGAGGVCNGKVLFTANDRGI